MQRCNLDELLTTAEAARLIFVPPRLIRVWAHRGKLTVHRGRDGRPRYRTGDVFDLDVAQRAKGHHHCLTVRVAG